MLNKSYYILIIFVVSFIINLYSLDIDLNGTCWKGLEIGNKFYYIIFTTDSTYIHYSFGVEEKTFGTYKTYNDSILFNREKGEFDDDFPVGSRHRIGEKTFWMYYKNKKLIPKELITENGFKYDKYDAKYYDWSYNLIKDYQYNKMVNKDPYFSYIPELWPSVWNNESNNGRSLTLVFEDYLYFELYIDDFNYYIGDVYAKKDTLFLSTPKFYGQNIKYDEVFRNNNVVQLHYKNGKLIGASENNDEFIFNRTDVK
jgi:hypothetical protein